MPRISLWTDEHVRAIGDDYSQAPLIEAHHVIRVSDDLDIWDAWPVQRREGPPIILNNGAELWMALAAPRFDDPDERHSHARIHLFQRRGEHWLHLGPAMPDGFSPGSREWSGSAIFDAGPDRVTLYFTVAGRRGEPVLTFEQRIFSAVAAMAPDGVLDDWRDLTEVVRIDPDHYMSTLDGGGQVGTIKAFRDPGYFVDPATGTHHLFFSGSLAWSVSAFNGAVGMATAPRGEPDGWRLQPPLISADALNNELERPHVILHDGLYYLFWSTQRHVFNPAGPTGPTGLYGMVAETLDGTWRPLNGSGLVFANPDGAPAQAYSWLVLPDLSVCSFIDNWGGGDRRFGATFAPFLVLELDGDHAHLKG